MTEIVAAHLERVAKLAEQLKLTPICEYETFLAATLAACAREARLDEAKLARKAIAEMDSRALFETWLDSHIKCLEIAERAVGEKA